MSDASDLKSYELAITMDGDNFIEKDKAGNHKIWSRNDKALGKGGFSQVYLYENGRSKWAVKRIASISGGGRTTLAEIEREKAALIKFSHRERFIRFNGWFAHNNIEYFALEYVELGDLEENLKKRDEPRGSLREAEVKTILTQILEGIEFMHAEGYIHRDLKPQNILVAQRGPDWQIKITDLGLSKCTIGVLEGYSFTGTPPYMAPEIYNSFLDPSNYTGAIDIWAVGCIACRMLIGEPPFSDPWLLSQYNKAIKESKPLDQLCSEVPYIPKPLAELLKAETLKGLLVRQLLEPQPKRRPSAKYAKGHPWLQDLDFCTLQDPTRRVPPGVVIPAKGITRVVFSPSGKLLAQASLDRKIRLWSVEECKRKHTLESPGDISDMRFLRDDMLVTLALSDHESVRVWYTETGEVKHTFKFPSEGCYYYGSRICSPDGSLVAAKKDYYPPMQRGYVSTIHPRDNGLIELWDTEKGERKDPFPYGAVAEVQSIRLSSNGELMALIFKDGTFIIWNTRKGIEESVFKDAPRFAVCVAFSPDGRFIALDSDDGIWLWDEKEKEAKCVAESFWTGSEVMIFSPDGKLAAIETYGDDIRLCNMGQEEETRILKGHSGYVEAVAFSPDSQLLASASPQTVTLWNIEKGEEIGILRAHPDGVYDVAFSPNGDFVATTSDDGTVGLWNVSQCKN